MEDRDFMMQALELAKEAAAEGEVPVGCVITRNGEVVGVGRNRRERGKSALCHAELDAIGQACEKLGGWRLWECTMYVTLEPCPMCAGAMVMGTRHIDPGTSEEGVPAKAGRSEKAQATV